MNPGHYTASSLFLAEMLLKSFSVPYLIFKDRH